MGANFIDQYAYLHFAAGIIAYFWGISLTVWIILHILFELVENTQTGIYIINRYLTFWPGGKPQPDAIINTVGDTLLAALGWISAYYLDKVGNKQRWYTLHIK